MRDIIKQRKAQHDSYIRNKEAVYQRNKQRRLDVKKWFAETVLASAHCIKCGEDDSVCLDFHHIDPSTKTGNVSELVGEMRSKERILTEVAKCIILCANCHRRYHAGQFSYPELPQR